MVERAAWPDVRGRSRLPGPHFPARKRPPVSRHACRCSLGRKRGVGAPVSNLDREVDTSARGRHEAGHERPASREDAGVELRSPEKGWSRPPAARVLCRGRSPLVVEPTATQVPAKVMTKRRIPNSQRLVGSGPMFSGSRPDLRTAHLAGGGRLSGEDEEAVEGVHTFWVSHLGRSKPPRWGSYL